MRLESFSIKDRAPIHHFAADGLADTVVIAGPNGVGKTRAINELLAYFQNLQSGNQIVLGVAATNENERTQWQQDRLLTSNAADLQKLRQYLQRNQKRGKWQGSVIHFDSSRIFDQVSGFAWNWDFPNPDEESIGWNYLFGQLRNRYSDNVHSIYKLVGHHRTDIAKRALQLKAAGKTEMALDFGDPLKKFKDAFALLLSPKKMADVDLREGGHNPPLKYVDKDDQIRNFESMSSGEREVVNIVFDLLLHDPEDCIIFFDEPELHLHPELSFRLLKTLQTVGARNQFIFCTHSADLITANLDNSVLFISPPKPDGSNQGQLIRPGDQNTTALRLLGQNLGVVSLGRRIVIIEGTEASLDRQTYGEILGKRFPSLVLTPAGTRQNILSFSRVVDDVLSKALWGIDFFMIADRDENLPDHVLTNLEKQAKGRLRFLPRYHLENYFLDPATIARAFANLEKPNSWLRDANQIDAKLQALAVDTLPYAVQLWTEARLRSEVGDVSAPVKGADKLAKDVFLAKLKDAMDAEHGRVSPLLAFKRVEAEVAAKWDEYAGLVAKNDPRWKAIFPGRPICNKFASLAGMDPGRFKNLYISAAREGGFSAFADLIACFEAFEAIASTGTAPSHPTALQAAE